MNTAAFQADARPTRAWFAPNRSCVSHDRQLASQRHDWRWLSEATSVTVDIVNGTQRHALDFALPSGSIRVVDQNAITVDIPSNCALSGLMCKLGPAQEINVIARNPLAPSETVRLNGVGSLGSARPNHASCSSTQIWLRLTTFTIEWSCSQEISNELNYVDAI